ncbi:MAG: nucleoside 2-deoxyribosyltransferase [Asticcacaulis sp.]
MKPVRSVYLAGPDVWFPNAAAHCQTRQERVTAAGLIPIDPFDTLPPMPEASELTARQLYAQRMAALRTADAVLANLTPWRGVGADPGTAFEVGVAAALGKPVVAYMNVAEDEDADHVDRVGALFGLVQDEAGVLRDSWGLQVEDFGLPETAMLWAETRKLYVVVTPELYGDLSGFDLALAALSAYAA